MAKKPEPKPRGRPEKPIDWKQFETLCGFMCTQKEIANFFHIHRENLCLRAEKHYGEKWADIYERFCAPGLCSLRRNQFVLSKTNAAMAIHLGKVLLNQKEIVVNETKTVTSQKAIIEAPDNGHRRLNEPDDEEI